MIKYKLDKNVYEEAKDRMRFLFDEFENIVVGFSGGKDSTVCVEIAIEIAKERNRLPVSILFIDQESEWQATIDYVKYMMYRPEINPIWLQVPMKIFNATSYTDQWINCWAEGEKWIREKDPVSLKENIYGTDRFKDLFNGFLKVAYKGKKACIIGGVRCDERPARRLALTTNAKYKHVTWGKEVSEKYQQFVFYPIYDWGITDVWKYIHDSNFKYNKLYDYMYQHGITLNNMRVSNVHHETALHSLEFLQEIEPDTWNKIVARLEGINTAGNKEMYKVDVLPYMFKDWGEYVIYLIENLVEKQEHKEIFLKQFTKYEELYRPYPDYHDSYCKSFCISVLKNDFELATVSNLAIRINMQIHNKYGVKIKAVK